MVFFSDRSVFVCVSHFELWEQGHSKLVPVILPQEVDTGRAGFEQGGALRMHAAFASENLSLTQSRRLSGWTWCIGGDGRDRRGDGRRRTTSPTVFSSASFVTSNPLCCLAVLAFFLPGLTQFSSGLTQLRSCASLFSTDSGPRRQ